MSVLVLSFFLQVILCSVKEAKWPLFGGIVAPQFTIRSLYILTFCYFTYFLFMFRGHGVPVPGDCLLHWFLHSRTWCASSW